MNNKQQTKRGFTIIEMLVVIAIVAALATMIVGVASRIESREKEKLGKNTLALLTTALAQFHEYDFVYKDPDYSAFNFPLDCNGFDEVQIAETLEDALGTGAGSIVITGAHDPNDSSNEVMYLLLSMVPASRKTLEKIDKKLVTSLGLDGQPMKITIGTSDDGKEYPLLRVIDPWGTTLRYDYYDDEAYPKDKRTFPLVISAGPDKKFGTDDDITSR